jgi:hypothetical protein
MHSRIVDNIVLFILQIVDLRCKGTNKRGENQILFGFSRARVPSTKSEVVQIERNTKEKGKKNKESRQLCCQPPHFHLFTFSPFHL